MMRGVLTALIAGFLVLPVLAIVPVAFDAHTTLRLPPQQFSWRWWGVFLADPGWLTSLLTSLQVGLLVALVATLAGTMAALGLPRLPPLLRGVVTAFVTGPIVTPAIVLAVALYATARSAGLVGTVTGLVLAHAVLALPYVVLTAGVSLRQVDTRLGLAASGMGAGPWLIFRSITLPLIAPGVLGGAVFAFVTSFDEIVLSIFLSGPGVTTLPVRMWEEIRVELTPVIAVAATLIIAVAVTAGGTGFALRRRAPLLEETRC